MADRRLPPWGQFARERQWESQWTSTCLSLTFWPQILRTPLVTILAFIMTAWKENQVGKTLICRPLVSLFPLSKDISQFRFSDYYRSHLLWYPSFFTFSLFFIYFITSYCLILSLSVSLSFSLYAFFLPLFTVIINVCPLSFFSLSFFVSYLNSFLYSFLSFFLFLSFCFCPCFIYFLVFSFFLKLFLSFFSLFIFSFFLPFFLSFFLSIFLSFFFVPFFLSLTLPIK